MYLTIVIGDRQPFTIATRGRDHAIELVRERAKLNPALANLICATLVWSDVASWNGGMVVLSEGAR